MDLIKHSLMFVKSNFIDRMLAGARQSEKHFTSLKHGGNQQEPTGLLGFV